MHARAGLSPELQRKINADVNRMLQMPDARARLLNMTYVAAGGTPQELDAYLAKDRAEIGEVIRKGNIRVEQ
jgi:tripartite-type tricarboxylate transporter receptor subunit TctC